MPDTELNLDTTLSIPEQVMSRLVDEETVLIDLSTGIYFGLDGVGQRIWESIADGCSIREIAAVIVAEYEIDVAKARSDVFAFVEDLLKRGLLTR